MVLEPYPPGTRTLVLSAWVVSVLVAPQSRLFLLLDVAVLRPEHTMRTKYVISDAFVRDFCVLSFMSSTFIPYQMNNFQTTQKRNLGRTRPRLRTLYA